jgi:hypothetical protein
MTSFGKLEVCVETELWRRDTRIGMQGCSYPTKAELDPYPKTKSFVQLFQRMMTSNFSDSSLIHSALIG